MNVATIDNLDFFNYSKINEAYEPIWVVDLKNENGAMVKEGDKVSFTVFGRVFTGRVINQSGIDLRIKVKENDLSELIESPL